MRDGDGGGDRGGNGRGRETRASPTATATQACPPFPARFVLGAGILCQPTAEQTGAGKSLYLPHLAS